MRYPHKSQNQKIAKSKNQKTRLLIAGFSDFVISFKGTLTQIEKSKNNC